MRRSLWWSARALRLHLTLAVLGPGFVALFWWQLHRALSGNVLSWAYAVEWPIFLAYAVFMWWRLLHEDVAAPRPDDADRADADRVRATGTLPASKAATARLRPGAEGRARRRERRLADEDRQRRAYNAYLRALDDEVVDDASGGSTAAPPEPSPLGPPES